MSRNTLQESARLGSGQSGWTLPGSSSTPPTSRTRHGGQGRPNLARIDYGEATSPNEEDESVEEEWDEQYESDEDYDNEDEWDEKPPATRLFLKQDATTSFIEKYSRCPNWYRTS